MKQFNLMYKTLYLAIFSLLTFSISSCDFVSGVKDLGEGYYLDSDQILYTDKPSYNGIGLCVVPPRVHSLGKTDDFIVVVSKDNSGILWYWLILKKQNKEEIKYNEANKEIGSYYEYKNIYGPLDSLAFEKVKEERKIPADLSLKEIK
jgi:hypothetical protein